MKYTLLIILALFTFNTLATNMYVAKVLKVDSNNVVHLGHDGVLKLINLAYLVTPVDGEPLHEEVNAYLAGILDGEWVRVTEVSYGRGALVRPSLVRLYDNTMLNTEIIKKGYALPDLGTKPPQAIMHLATEAKESNLGVWSLVKEFAHARYVKEGSTANTLFGDMTAALTRAKENNLQPYLLDSTTMTAYPLKCLMSVENPQMVSTIHVAEHRGYVLNEDCPTK